MVYYSDDEEPEFDDRVPEDWEEILSRPEPNFEDWFPASHLAEHVDESPSDLSDQNDYGSMTGDPLLDRCVKVPITDEMWLEATKCGREMDGVYGQKNDFGNDNRLSKQRRGVLGTMAYAQAAFGDWRRHRDAAPNQADFAVLDVKSSRLAPHWTLSKLHLIESESSPGIDPPCYPIYVQVFVDDKERLAYVAGWCTGKELWAEGKTPIPCGRGSVGYQRPVAHLRPMASLPRMWDQLIDTRWARFRPDHLGH